MMLATEDARSIALVVGDWIIAFGALPTLGFVLEYGFIRWLRRRGSQPKFKPWWKSLVGTMIFLLAFGLLAVEANVIATLFLGQDYWGREVFRIVGYSLSSASAILLLVVYGIEGGKAERDGDSAMVPRATGPEGPKS